MRSIGIDIGTYSVKVVDLEVSNKYLTINDCLEYALNSDPASDRRIQILETMREILQKFDPAKSVFSVSLPQQHISLRHKVFPFRDRYKIVRSLPFELEDDIPLTQEKAIFEAKILHYRKASAEVLAMACPKDVIGGILSQCLDAQLDPDILSCEAVALSALHEDWNSPIPEVTEPEDQMDEDAAKTELSFHTEPGMGHLHLGHNRSVLSVYHNGSLLTTRTLFSGGVHIIQALQKVYNIPYADALKGLIEKGFILTTPEGANQDQITFSNTITEALREMVVEVRRELLEIQSDFKIRLNQIELSGGLSQLLNICPFLTQAFELPCNILKPLHSFGRQDLPDSLGSRVAVAFGLAIEGARRPSNPAANFRKDEFSKENHTFKLLWEKWNYAAKLAAAATACLYIYTFVRDPLALSLSEASYSLLKKKAQEAGLKKSESSPLQVQKYIREKEKEIHNKTILAELQDINSAMVPLNKLSELVPDKVRMPLDVRHFSIKNEILSIEGEVSRKENIQDVKQALMALSADRVVNDAVSTIRPEPGRFAFSFSTRVNRKQRGL